MARVWLPQRKGPAVPALQRGERGEEVPVHDTIQTQMLDRQLPGRDGRPWRMTQNSPRGRTLRPMDGRRYSMQYMISGLETRTQKRRRERQQRWKTLLNKEQLLMTVSSLLTTKLAQRKSGARGVSGCHDFSPLRIDSDTTSKGSCNNALGRKTTLC